MRTLRSTFQYKECSHVVSASLTFQRPDLDGVIHSTASHLQYVCRVEVLCMSLIRSEVFRNL